MAQAFSKSTVTLAVATAQNLAALLAAEGYTGSMAGSFLEIEDNVPLGDVFWGGDNTVDAATGRPLTVPFSRTAQMGAVDPSRIWLFSTAGGDISVSFEPL